jgi:hypothetical protein
MADTSESFILPHVAAVKTSDRTPKRILILNGAVDAMGNLVGLPPAITYRQ